MTLVIDLGTVNTVGMASGRVVTVDGAPWLPTAVHAGVVGADAVALGRGQESRDLKESLDPAALRAVFARMTAAARAQGGDAGEVVVTHPAAWGPDRVAVLAAAAGATSTVAEPIAVAAGQGVAAGETVLVVDAGGGTWDVTAVRGLPDGYAVAAHGTLPVGGNDLDRRIVARVRPSLREPGADEAAPREPGADEAALLESARAGKEHLSRHDSTEIVLPDHRAVRLDRLEFEGLIAADVDRLVALVGSVGAAVPFDRVLLVGGSSRVPLIARTLTAATGHKVVTDPEPETAVVRGAHLLIRLGVREDPLAEPPQPPPREPAYLTPTVALLAQPLPTQPPPTPPAPTQPPPAETGSGQPLLTQPVPGQVVSGQAPRVRPLTERLSGQVGSGQPPLAEPLSGQVGSGQPPLTEPLPGTAGSGQAPRVRPVIGQAGSSQALPVEPSLVQSLAGQMRSGQVSPDERSLGQVPLGQVSLGPASSGGPSLAEPLAGQVTSGEVLPGQVPPVRVPPGLSLGEPSLGQPLDGQEPPVQVSPGESSVSAMEPRPPSGARQGAPRWRSGLAVVVGLLLVAGVAVAFGGGRGIAGQPVAVAAGPALAEAVMPPALAGQEVVNGTVAGFTDGRLGEPVRYRHPAGALLDVTVTGVDSTRTAPGPFLDSPEGFRWVFLRLRFTNVDGPDLPADPLEGISVLDDRGQRLRSPLGAGQVPCTPGAPVANRVAAGQTVEACGVVPVPLSTPVTAVLFEAAGGPPAVRFPIDVTAAEDRSAPARVVGELGGPAVNIGGLRARVELVNTPSGYLGARLPAPGHRFVVVRVAATAAGDRHIAFFLRDDRGALLHALTVPPPMQGCPVLPGDLRPNTPAYGCLVYEVAARTPVEAVTFAGRGLDPTSWSTWR